MIRVAEAVAARLVNHRREINLCRRTGEDVVTDNEGRALKDAQATSVIEIFAELVGDARCGHIVAQAIDVQTDAFGGREYCVLLPGTVVGHQRLVEFAVLVLASRGE